MSPVNPNQFKLSDKDIEIKTTRGTGPGGQHKNKVSTCVVLRHLPSGVTARIDGRSQKRNKEIARELLESRVSQLLHDKQMGEEKIKRKAQVGSGMRADKTRTYRYRDNVVIDHKTGRKKTMKQILSGDINFTV
jgi:peptide chain release factor 1